MELTTSQKSNNNDQTNGIAKQQKEMNQQKERFN
jgi:hypothetical protein